MNLLDNIDLDAAADTAARLNRWEFMLVGAPLRVPGGTGSPVNPIRHLLSAVRAPPG